MTPSVSTPKYEPSKEERLQAATAKRDKLKAIQEQVTSDSNAWMQMYGQRGVLSGSPLSLR
jgi:hypothetical protein